MARRAAHYETPTKLELSKRQREVLSLITEGKTNGEIAERLGISLDGAKWHVSEILGKVGVSTREEAAEWWLAQLGLGSRVASFARAFGWLATWKVGGGAAVGVAAIAVVIGVFALTRSDESRDTPRVLPDCDLEKVFLEPIEARDSQGFFALAALTARTETECLFRGSATATVASPQSLPQGFALPTVDNSHWIVDAVIGPRREAIAYATWNSWCASIPTTQLTFRLSRPGTTFPDKSAPPLFLVNTPKCDESVGVSPIEVMPAALSSFLPDLGPEERIFCYADPKWQKQCEQVDRLHQALIGQVVQDAFVRFAQTTEFVCPSGGFEGSSTLCRDVPTGEKRSGIPVAFHGSEGDVLSVDQLRARLAGLIDSGNTRVASVGCPTATSNCDEKFAIGFAVDSQPAAFYLVFETRADVPHLAAVGISGDNALEIRRGGKTMTGVGEMLFTSAVPPY